MTSRNDVAESGRASGASNCPLCLEHLGWDLCLDGSPSMDAQWAVCGVERQYSDGPASLARPFDSANWEVGVEALERFAGVDWGSQQHHVRVLDTDGNVPGERSFEHGGTGLSELADWLLSFTAGETGGIGVAVDTPRGRVVESLMERGLVVHSINPKQLDRFRDRFSPAGAKDDRRDARVLASALRTGPSLPAAPGVDRSDDHRVARVVATQRVPDAGAYAPREPDAGTAVALLPAVPRCYPRRRPGALGTRAVEEPCRRRGPVDGFARRRWRDCWRSTVLVESTRQRCAIG